MKTVDCKTQQELNDALERGDYPNLVGGGVFKLTGNSQARLYGNSQARLYDNSQATLYDNSQARLYDNSQATLTGNSQARLYDNSQARLTDNSQARLYDNSQARLYGNSQARLTDNSQARLYGNSQARLYDNSQARLTDNSQATLTGNSQARLYGNSQARLYGNSQATLYGGAQASAFDQASVVAGKYSAVTVHGKKVKCSGGVRIDIPQIATAKEWCDFHGVEVKRGIAILFKAVDDDYSTSNARPRGIFYKPGEKPIADDWDGGLIECGRGLHFSPSPAHALRFNTEAKRFIACPVKISGIKVHKNAQFPEKVKAQAVSQPCYEVNIDGERIA